MSYWVSSFTRLCLSVAFYLWLLLLLYFYAAPFVYSYSILETLLHDISTSPVILIFVYSLVSVIWRIIVCRLAMVHGRRVLGDLLYRTCHSRLYREAAAVPAAPYDVCRTRDHLLRSVNLTILFSSQTSTKIFVRNENKKQGYIRICDPQRRRWRPHSMTDPF